MKAAQNIVPFSNDPAKEERLQGIIDKYKEEKGALIPVLQQAQDIYGYLPIEVQMAVAKGLDVPLEKIYGVVTFYSFFNLIRASGIYKFNIITS